MKAIRVEQFGDEETLKVQEVPDPRPGPGQILVRLHAAGVNPVETYIRAGKYAKLPELPYTPGTDGAGRVEAVGEGVEAAVGSRVYVAGSITGTYAQLCLCEARQVHPLPETISFAQGAALGVPYVTAYRALFQRGGARAGETLLIHGGTGGVGLAALQWALSAGLTPFATGGTEEGRALLSRLGAKAVYDHHVHGYLDQLREATEGKGVDVILEMLANVNLGQDLGALAQGGRVAVIGSRGPVEINPRDLMVREADVRGVMGGAGTPEEQAEAHRAIGEGLRAGKLQPLVERQYPLAEAPAAHREVMSPGAHGKIVLIL